MRYSLLALSLSLALLLGCQPHGTPVNPEVSPTPVNSAGPVGSQAQPPAIPSFPSQGSIPEGRPGGGRGGMFGGDEISSAPMLSAPAAAEMSAGAGAVADSSAPVSRSGEKTSRPIGPIMPPYDPDFPEEPQVQPEPGLLTAGQWDDHAHWDFWLKLTNNQEWSQYLSQWGMNTKQRVAVQVNGPQGPMGDVPVTLYQGQTAVFQARTNNQGQAYVFKQWQANAQAEGDYEVRVDLGSDTLTQSLSGDAQNLSFQSETALEPLVNADLMLVVDTTGSMGDELEYLKQELKNVSGRIAAQSRQDLKLRLSANFYRDTTDDYVVRSFPFTEDSNTVAQQLSEQSAGGGGDFPEAVDYALMDAIDEHQWSTTAKARLLFLVLDAPAHQSESVLQRLRTSVERAAAKGIRIIPVASSGINKETEFLLRAMAASTGGRYVFLTDDSGIGGGHIEPTVGDYTVEKLNDLMIKIATAYIGEATVAPEPQQEEQQQDDTSQQQQ